MARARNIKPGLFKNEILGQADPLYTLLFEGLWVLADREGRLEDRPLRIKAEIFPYREGLSVDNLLTWLHDNSFIMRYEVEGKKYIQVLSFAEHQNPHRDEKKSIIPAPCKHHATTVQQQEIHQSSPASSLIPDSLNTDSLIPDPLIPSTLIPELFPQALPAAPDRKISNLVKIKPDEPTAKLQEACAETWKSYSQAYFDRYGTEPIRNAMVNSLVKSFVKRIPYAEAPPLAAWFLQHTAAFYVNGGHGFNLLTKDAEKLRTEWATGRRMNGIKARQVERVGGMSDVVNELLRENTH